MKLGIAISTYVPDGSRIETHERFKETLQSLEQTDFPGEIIVVDDGSTHPIHLEYLNSLKYRVIKKEVNGGVSRVKNTSMRALMENNIDIGFLADDDVAYKTGWWQIYVEAHEKTGIHHFSWADKRGHNFTKHEINGFAINQSTGLNGILLTFTPEVIKQVGGMKILPAKHGFEHCNWTFRIIAAKLTPFYADVTNSNDFILLSEKWWASTVNNTDRANYIRQNEFCVKITDGYLPLEE